ncbi:MAG TPA: hypothetical protein VLT16_11085 [Candidatus Limnocylindrales bacterium]|nr:hypothetical protein [Candidatus Limnocylindrales bacterium]
MLSRFGARELTPEQVEAVTGGDLCRITFSHLPGGSQDEDTQCP